MSGKPDNWKKLTPEEKRSVRLDAWARGDGIKFDSPEAEAKYKERANLFRDALELKKNPVRIPVNALAGAFALRRKGINQKATMYERWQEAAEAMIQFHRDFEPDCSSFIFLNCGPAMEMLQQTNMKWAGFSLPDDVQYQFVEQEYMKSDEYPHFLEDPTDFMIRCYIPRLHTSLKGLEKFPRLAADSIGLGFPYGSFLDGELQESFELMKKTAEMSMEPARIALETGERLAQIGFPAFTRGFGAAPFDVLGDSLRGTSGTMVDLYRQPDNVIKACEKILRMMPVPDAPLGVTPVVMMPLHKGSDGFMSQKQYEQFYWPTFKAFMLRMIDEGLIPSPFAEGVFDSRLEYIRELPKAATSWLFDRTDMKKAKDILGDVCSIQGNVPITQIATGTGEQVKESVKQLIDYCGKGGGYILAPGTQVDDGQEETVGAMIEFAKEYGMYN
ncbi:MAG: hypothetical protein JW864_08755 [Spirochaetes bacterium]|nr:hypothetical protein [Spirochaetota bacterium]